jgi:hypothetical protein
VKRKYEGDSEVNEKRIPKMLIPERKGQNRQKRNRLKPENQKGRIIVIVKNKCKPSKRIQLKQETKN